ncbi:MAG: hypothetical protein J0I84_15750 [Terrimonas sp.]|nr:hypothetical protein [Terrimonas sp.]OJY92178.1 MAG: hypothetical protein BGP13_08420 [Sphingobacteriales bacterium 40-81]
MKIQGNEAAKINEMLKEELSLGNRYVSLDTGKADEYFRADKMKFFNTKSGVQHHNYIRYMIDGECREALPILSLQEQLQRKMELQQISRLPGSEPKDIVIDAGIIHYQERARREIFTEDIIRQLQAYNMKPDVRQLQEHIITDDQQFIIEGTHPEKGVERFYTIHITQNKDRAFLVGDIEPQQTFHQQKNRTTMNEITEGTVRKEDAREIRDMLRTELENGNRFVSFPADKPNLTKEDFNVFKSAFGALQNAYENSTDRDLYAVRSASAVEKEMNRLLETEKEQKPDKPKENEREEKPKTNEQVKKPPRDHDRFR